MAVNMKDIKAISIPEGTVNKIEDSNGNIIWGSQDAFPYRKLEYIHFNGAERVLTDFYAGTAAINHQSEFTLDEMPSSGNMQYCAIYDNTIANGLKRFYLAQVNTTGLHINVGNTWSNYASSLPLNTKLKLSCTYQKSSNKPRVYYYLTDTTTSSNILTAAPLDGPDAGDLNTSKYIPIGCIREAQTGGSDTWGSYWKGKCYNYQRRQNNASGTLLTNYIPCQRKSDSVCGLYDTVGGNFFPMVGTTITDAAAGPVLDEYWNLQA